MLITPEAIVRLPAAKRDPVQLIGPDIGLCRSYLMGVQSGFLVKPCIIAPNIQSAFGHVKIIWQMGMEFFRCQADRSRRSNIIFYTILSRTRRWHNAITPNHAGQNPPSLPDWQGSAPGSSHPSSHIGLVTDGRAFTHMVIAHQRQHTACCRGASQICVTENIACSIHARPLAIPDAKHAIIFALAK